MKKSEFTESQIVFPIKQSEQGVRVDEICRKMGIFEVTFYIWKKKYGGLGMSELRELKMLKDENVRLKKIVADLSLDKQMLQDVIRKSFEAYSEEAAGRLSEPSVSGFHTKVLQDIDDTSFSFFLSASPKGRYSTKKPSSGDCNNTGEVWPQAYLHIAE